VHTVCEEGGNGEAEGDDGKTVKTEEQHDDVRVGVVDDGTVACRNKEYAGDEEAADR